MKKDTLHVEGVQFFVPWSRYRTDDCSCGETIRTDLPPDATVDLDDWTLWDWVHHCPDHVWGEDSA